MLYKTTLMQLGILLPQFNPGINMAVKQFLLQKIKRCVRNLYVSDFVYMGLLQRHLPF